MVDPDPFKRDFSPFSLGRQLKVVVGYTHILVPSHLASQAMEVFAASQIVESKYSDGLTWYGEDTRPIPCELIPKLPLFKSAEAAQKFHDFCEALKDQEPETPF